MTLAELQLRLDLARRAEKSGEILEYEASGAYDQWSPVPSDQLADFVRLGYDLRLKPKLDAPKPLPCPFCGTIPLPASEPGCYVVIHTKGCELGIRNGPNSWIESGFEPTARWNRRAPCQTCREAAAWLRLHCKHSVALGTDGLDTLMTKLEGKEG